MYTIHHVKRYILTELAAHWDGMMLTTEFMFLKSKMSRAYPSYLFDQAVSQLEQDGQIAVNRTQLDATRLRRDHPAS